MANHYKNNAKLLEKTLLGPAVLAMLEHTEEQRQKIVKKDGVEYFEHENKYYKLHSANEQAEADRILKGIQKNRDYILVVWGLANVLLVEKLVEKTSENTKILIVEENVHLLRHRMYFNRMDSILKSKKVVLTLGEEKLYSLAIRAGIQGGWTNLLHNLKVIMLPSYQIYGKEIAAKMHKMTEEMRTDIYALGNSTEDMMNGVTNNYQNVDACITCNSIDEIRGKYKGIPGIVVASGPSLDKNIDLLKEAEGNAVIIACDASYQQCIKRGVKPDAIASIERDIPTYNFFYKGKKFDDDLVFVGPGLVWPDILEEFPGKKILMSKNPDGADGWWMRHFDNVKFEVMGFSCANVAHAVLEAAGCDPIILIGQDLAYTDDKQHSEEAHAVFGSDNQIVSEGSYIWTEDIYGNQVKTSKTFNLFREYFERKTELGMHTLIDATEGGAKIQGSKIMSFREAIDQYCTKPKDKAIYEYLKDIPWDDEIAIEKYDEIIKSCKELIRLIEQLECQMREHVKRIYHYENFDFEHAKREQLVECVLTMQEANNLITYVTEKNRDLSTFYGHIYKSAIMQVKKLGNELTPESVKENWRIQIRLIYLMQIVSQTVRDKYQEMIDFMEQKKEKLQEKR